MGLIGACSKAFDALGDLFDCLPVAIRICIYAAVGLFFLFGLFKLFLE